VVDVDLLGDRQLRLRHIVKDGVELDAATRDATLAHIRRLWGYDVSLAGVEPSGDKVLYECSTASAG
jgi:spore cortex formation protein SpoVR/YcgB (stage V sporulation)